MWGLLCFFGGGYSFSLFEFVVIFLFGGGGGGGGGVLELHFTFPLREISGRLTLIKVQQLHTYLAVLYIASSTNVCPALFFSLFVWFVDLL